jgi:hypothetical protein
MISQPMYFPWAGFMAQMALADVMIWLDDAQFSKGSFTNRVQVKHPQGMKWMTIPLLQKNTLPRIMDLATPEIGLFLRHRSLLLQSLEGRPFRDQALELFDEAIGTGPLIDRLIASAEQPAQRWGILPATIHRSSAMGVQGSSWQRVLRLVQAVGGSTYITGHGAKNYLQHHAFEAGGIRVRYMVYDPLPWSQGPLPFTPYVANLDLFSSVAEHEASAHLRPCTIDWKTFLVNGDCQ